MKKIRKILLLLVCVMLIAALGALPAMAAEEAEQTTEQAAEQAETAVGLGNVKALAAGGLIAIAAGVGAVSMAISISKSAESTARQPEAAGDIRSSLMLGLVFLETAIIYALIVAILIIFVL